MPESLVHKYGPLAAPFLEPGERILDVASIVPARGARGVGLGASRAAGEAIAQAGAVKGGQGSIADSFPHGLPQAWTRLLCATDRRLLFLLVSPGTHREAQVIWQVPRSAVVGVERRPRLQLMARFRLHFTDGSSAAVMTFRRRTIDSLAGALGAGR
jgi:hypothetical protein